MRFVDPTKPYRKSGGMGHPGICCAAEDKKCPVSYPAGRLRRWTTLRKTAHAALSTAVQQEIRVRSVEKHFQERSAELQIPRLRSG
jgi:hypothetical protein